MFALLAGCSTAGKFIPEGDSIELDEVPFFPQAEFQCGPAALATILDASGVGVTPDELVSQVYVPERRGSFQLEMQATTRAYGRLPYTLEPAPEALFAELADGRPVLVLQNLLFDWYPRWHYAVVVGYDAQRKRVLLRSGTEPRRAERLDRFLASWQRAGNWGMLSLEPGALPATADADNYLAMLAASEGFLATVEYESALMVGLQAWPEHADLLFAAGNFARVRQQPLIAAEYYRAALNSQPLHTGVRNNFADLLLEESCLESAASVLEPARERSDLPEAVRAVILTTATELEYAAQKQGGYQDFGARCALLASG